MEQDLSGKAPQDLLARVQTELASAKAQLDLKAPKIESDALRKDVHAASLGRFR